MVNRIMLLVLAVLLLAGCSKDAGKLKQPPLPTAETMPLMRIWTAVQEELGVAGGPDARVESWLLDLETDGTLKWFLLRVEAMEAKSGQWYIYQIESHGKAWRFWRIPVTAPRHRGGPEVAALFAALDEAGMPGALLSEAVEPAYFSFHLGSSSGTRADRVRVVEGGQVRPLAGEVKVSPSLIRYEMVPMGQQAFTSNHHRVEYLIPLDR